MITTKSDRFGNETKVHIKLWADREDYFEEGALSQVANMANLPFAFHHVCIMPDGHQGYGMPIGGVLATRGVVVPNAVGVDIGCGMCAIQLPIMVENIKKDVLKKIMGDIRQTIPVGMNRNKDRHDIPLQPFTLPIVNREYSAAEHQIGTLGGGNHFIEFQYDEKGFVWIMIHSGSRNLGKQVADHYNKLAIELNEKWYSSIPKEWQLAFLPLDSVEGDMYLAEMKYCVEFALANRKLMMERIIEIICQTVTISEPLAPMINIAHNYAQMEHHFGSDVMVHRKGATLARTDTIGIIPGSQGTSSYIVQGLSNPESFNSCSHGAGRRMGRKEAERTLVLEEQQKLMDDQGIIHGIRHASNLDEAPGAYKDILTVMDNQKDLVKILHTLKPLAVIKGD